MAGVAAILKPFAWLALMAFVAGFVSYFALGEPSQAFAKTDPRTAEVSFPASADWNLPRHI